MATSNAFGSLPSTANKDAFRSFTVDIPAEKISQMRTLIELAPIAEPCYENTQASDERQYGVTRDWLTGMKDKWLNNFDWKKHEEHINTFPNFKASISDPATSSDPYSIHFVGLFSSRSDALPLLLSHGWPGSFLEFLPMLELIQKQYDSPDKLPYHIIVPSLPGFAFSSAYPMKQPLKPNGEVFGMDSVARIFDNLMSGLFGPSAKYVAQGGDIGSRITRILAAQYPNCLAAHLNYSAIIEVPQPSEGEPPLHINAIEHKGLERYEWFKKAGSAYAIEQSTKPSTLGLALSTSPLALLAWVGEKFLDWTDPASFASSPPHYSPSSAFATDILVDVSLYWLSGSIATTFFTYRESFAGGGAKPLKSHTSPEYHIKEPKMLGHSWFPMELAPMPISWVETTGNLVWWRRHEVGGHFPYFGLGRGDYGVGDEIGKASCARCSGWKLLSCDCALPMVDSCLGGDDIEAERLTKTASSKVSRAQTSAGINYR